MHISFRKAMPIMYFYGYKAMLAEVLYMSLYCLVDQFCEIEL